ncbi:MAG: DUF1552 domain-containing protein [Deltaproteobacteria bacterium]|nr:DUF1552 domain-containing protein [Deltaproteobacteria bacterium]
MTPKAFAAAPVRPRLVWLTTDHGGAFETSFFPKQSLLTQKADVYADHAAKAGPLVPTSESGKTVLSTILQASSGTLTPALLRKMNVIAGLDVPYYLGHHSGGHLGNFARNDGNGADGSVIQTNPRPTIDQIMAWSRSFYPDLSGIRERSILFGGSTISYSFSSPQTRTGGIQALRGSVSTQAVFDRIFAVPNADDPSRKRVVDRVLESYKQMRNGSKRLSGSDKQRLDDHIARIDELERKLSAQPAAACSNVNRPTDDANKHGGGTAADALAQANLICDVIAAAFMCGSTRIATWGVGETARMLSYTSGSWHNDVAHQWSTPTQQALLVQSYQKFFEDVLVNLAKRLDVEEAEGRTYLDNTLLVWTQECGMVTHEQASIPVVTFGSGAGKIKTGQYLDYRRHENPKSSFDAGGTGYKQIFGVLYTRWLANVLTVMGVARPEFELWGHQGYGIPYIGNDNRYKDHFGSSVATSRHYNDASAALPLLMT